MSPTLAELVERCEELKNELDRLDEEFAEKKRDAWARYAEAVLAAEAAFVPSAAPS